ncbi:MAG: adenosylcobinamide-GDP ribazoletransferase, partial [Selenomonadaceae bacterium]|nr:adenosylcobinamide-GDP ribazoletransferase [Selenomonadaceae bacterium]
MRSFLIGLQFLTRITLERQTVWTEEDFGRSVRWFPLVGAVLGSIYALMMFAMIELTAGRFPTLEAALALLMSTALTGAIHCDGFMDTFDGLFSGRDRARMLEIKKDSRVGAFGVVSF